MQNALKSVAELIEQPVHRTDVFADELVELVLHACAKLSKEGEHMRRVAQVMSLLALEYNSKAGEAERWRREAEHFKALFEACGEAERQHERREVHIHQSGSNYFNHSQLPDSHFG